MDVHTGRNVTQVKNAPAGASAAAAAPTAGCATAGEDGLADADFARCAAAVACCTAACLGAFPDAECGGTGSPDALARFAASMDMSCRSRVDPDEERGTVVMNQRSGLIVLYSHGWKR